MIKKEGLQFITKSFYDSIEYNDRIYSLSIDKSSYEVKLSAEFWDIVEVYEDIIAIEKLLPQDLKTNWKQGENIDIAGHFGRCVGTVCTDDVLDMIDFDSRKDSLNFNNVLLYFRRENAFRPDYDIGICFKGRSDIANFLQTINSLVKEKKGTEGLAMLNSTEISMKYRNNIEIGWIDETREKAKVYPLQEIINDLETISTEA